MFYQCQFGQEGDVGLHYCDWCRCASSHCVVQVRPKGADCHDHSRRPNIRISAGDCLECSTNIVSCVLLVPHLSVLCLSMAEDGLTAAAENS